MHPSGQITSGDSSNEGPLTALGLTTQRMYSSFMSGLGLYPRDPDPLLGSTSSSALQHVPWSPAPEEYKQFLAIEAVGDGLYSYFSSAAAPTPSASDNGFPQTPPAESLPPHDVTATSPSMVVDSPMQEITRATGDQRRYAVTNSSHIDACGMDQLHAPHATATYSALNATLFNSGSARSIHTDNGYTYAGGDIIYSNPLSAESSGVETFPSIHTVHSPYATEPDQDLSFGEFLEDIVPMSSGDVHMQRTLTGADRGSAARGPATAPAAFALGEAFHAPRPPVASQFGTHMAMSSHAQYSSMNQYSNMGQYSVADQFSPQLNSVALPSSPSRGIAPGNIYSPVLNSPVVSSPGMHSPGMPSPLGDARSPPFMLSPLPDASPASPASPALSRTPASPVVVRTPRTPSAVRSPALVRSPRYNRSAALAPARSPINMSDISRRMDYMSDFSHRRGSSISSFADTVSSPEQLFSPALDSEVSVSCSNSSFGSEMATLTLAPDPMGITKLSTSASRETMRAPRSLPASARLAAARNRASLSFSPAPHTPGAIASFSPQAFSPQVFSPHIPSAPQSFGSAPAPPTATSAAAVSAANAAPSAFFVPPTSFDTATFDTTAFAPPADGTAPPSLFNASVSVPAPSPSPIASPGRRSRFAKRSTSTRQRAMRPPSSPPPEKTKTSRRKREIRYDPQIEYKKNTQDTFIVCLPQMKMEVSSVNYAELFLDPNTPPDLPLPRAMRQEVDYGIELDCVLNQEYFFYSLPPDPTSFGRHVRANAPSRKVGLDPDHPPPHADAVWWRVCFTLQNQDDYRVSISPRDLSLEDAVYVHTNRRLDERPPHLHDRQALFLHFRPGEFVVDKHDFGSESWWRVQDCGAVHYAYGFPSWTARYDVIDSANPEVRRPARLIGHYRNCKLRDHSRRRFPLADMSAYIQSHRNGEKPIDY